jgi:hypothetical protein
VGRGRSFWWGTEWGGSCAIEMLRLAPQRVAAVVLVGCKVGHRPEPDFRDRFIEELKRDLSGTVRNWVSGLLGPNVKEEIRGRAWAIAGEQSGADLIRGVRVFHGRTEGTEVIER